VIEEAVAYLEARLSAWPRVAVVLGSAQASFARSVSNSVEIDYRRIPGWPCPSVPGHSGKLIVGEAGGKPVVVLSGRVHLYEGRTPQEVTFGIRVLGRLGLRSLVLTNAAGGINPAYQMGMLVLITDHLNLQAGNPLIGQNDDTFGPRFPDMTAAYDAAYRDLARQAAAAAGVALGEGVYAALLGPSFETPAEIRYLRSIGADLVGMSTVPEVIVARHMGVRVLAFSTVTNLASGMQDAISHEEVLEIGRSRSDDLARLLNAVLPQLEG
jgi:purine-nucleoside phosphorylase